MLRILTSCAARQCPTTELYTAGRYPFPISFTTWWMYDMHMFIPVLVATTYRSHTAYLKALQSSCICQTIAWLRAIPLTFLMVWLHILETQYIWNNWREKRHVIMVDTSSTAIVCSGAYEMGEDSSIPFGWILFQCWNLENPCVKFVTTWIWYADSLFLVKQLHPGKNVMTRNYAITFM